jgi:hypothetical protein
MRSSYFRERISKNQIDQLTITNDTNTLIDPELFQLILEYIYTDKCPWLNFSQKIKTRDEHEYEVYLTRMKSIDDDMDDHRHFARVRQQASGTNQQQHGTKSKKKKKAGMFCHLCIRKFSIGFILKVILHHRMNILLDNSLKKN